jgi:hypothetical protein
MLQRSTQVGEFYRMQAPKVFEKGRLPAHYMGTPTLTPAFHTHTFSCPPSLAFFADIVIYDEEQDKHVHITVREALRAAMHGSTANQGPVDGGFFGNQDTGTIKSAIAAAKKIAGDDGMASAVPNGADVDADTIADMVGNGIWMPLEIIIARPFIEHLMMSAIMAVSGRDTGATLFGPADMRTLSETQTPPCLQPPCLQPPCLLPAWRLLTTLATFCARRDLGQHLRQDDRGCAAAFFNRVAPPRYYCFAAT